MIDFLIVTALKEELDAVRAKLGMKRPIEKQTTDPDVHTYYRKSLTTARSDRAVYDIVATRLDNMGPIEAGVQTAYAIGRWRPRAVLMVGIAGGVEGSSALGDLLLARVVADYTLGKVETSRVVERVEKRNRDPATGDRPVRQTRWEARHVDRGLHDSGLALSAGWTKKVKVKRPRKGAPKVLSGVVVSGGDVIAAAAFVATLKLDWAKLIGLEMEGGGVATAAAASARTPRFLMIRGVSDLADKKKNDAATKKWRPYACDVAATFLLAFLASGPIPPQPSPVAPESGTDTSVKGTIASSATPRDRDVRTLWRLLSTIATADIDYLVERGRAFAIPHRIFHFVEGFRAVYAAADFHINDPTLRKAVTSFAKPFLKMFSFSDYFSPRPGGTEYGFVGYGLAPEERRRAARKQFAKTVEDADAAFRQLLTLVQTSWQEIDIEETSNAALLEYQEFEKRMDGVLGG